MPSITTCLWFETQAEEAARFYTSVFGNARASPRSSTTARRGHAQREW